MCGRYTLTRPPAQIERLFETPDAPEMPPRYNIAPSQDVPVVRAESAGRRCRMVRWGLVPHWAKDPSIGHRMVNARSETAAGKPAFRNAFARRRCLIPADGFYEWKAEADGKQPYWFALADGSLFAFAGLWDRWSDPSGGALETCTILTTRPNARVAEVHDRMPVILPREAWGAWLGEDPADTEALKSLLVPWPAEAITARRVSRAVNRPSHDAPDCIQPA